MFFFTLEERKGEANVSPCPQVGDRSSGGRPDARDAFRVSESDAAGRALPRRVRRARPHAHPQPAGKRKGKQGVSRVRGPHPAARRRCHKRQGEEGERPTKSDDCGNLLLVCCRSPRWRRPTTQCPAMSTGDAGIRRKELKRWIFVSFSLCHGRLPLSTIIEFLFLRLPLPTVRESLPIR